MRQKLILFHPFYNNIFYLKKSMRSTLIFELFLLLIRLFLSIKKLFITINYLKNLLILYYYKLSYKQ